MITYLRNLVRPNTASVLSQFTTTVDKLTAIGHRELDAADRTTENISIEVQRHAAEIERLDTKRGAHIAEAVVAQKAAVRIKEVLGL